MGVPTCIEFFAIPVRPRRRTSFVDRDVGSLCQNTDNANTQQDAGKCSYPAKCASPHSVVAKALIFGCMLAGCVLAGFLLGATYGLPAFHVKSPRGNADHVSSFNFSLPHSLVHGRRLSTSEDGPSDSTAEAEKPKNEKDEGEEEGRVPGFSEPPQDAGGGDDALQQEGGSLPEGARAGEGDLLYKENNNPEQEDKRVKENTTFNPDDEAGVNIPEATSPTTEADEGPLNEENNNSEQKDKRVKENTISNPDDEAGVKTSDDTSPTAEADEGPPYEENNDFEKRGDKPVEEGKFSYAEDDAGVTMPSGTPTIEADEKSLYKKNNDFGKEEGKRVKEGTAFAGDGEVTMPEGTSPTSKPSSHRKQRRRKKRTDNLNGPDPHTYRRELCSMLRSDKTLQEWFALIVLYVAEWPTYARHGNGGVAYLNYLRGLAENFEVPRHAAVQVQMLFAEELSCATPTFFLQGLDAVAKGITRHHDLIMVMRKYREDPDFADLIDYTQVTKVPADVSISGFPMILRTAFEGFAFCFSRNLYIKADKEAVGTRSKYRDGTGVLTMSDFYNTYVRQYQHNQFQYWLLLMMASVMKRLVSSRPHAGIMVLKFDSAQALGMSRGRGMHEFDKAAIDSLQRQVAASVEGKLDRSLQRFQNFQLVQSPLIGATSALRPNVSVTGYLEQTQAGVFVDHGIFGMDMETDTLEELKERMKPGNLLVDVSLVDPWSSRPVSEWPDPLQRDMLALTAYTATQLLCAELQWDPSLGNLGHVEVVYSGFADVYGSAGGAQQAKAKFDPDVQVLLLRDNQKFVEDGQEEGTKKKIISLVAQEPLQWGHKRVIDAERIQWRGIARLLRGGQMYRKNAFGMGLSPALRRNAEELLKPNVVLIHIVIEGLGNLPPDSIGGFDMTASEMASRLVRRCRGIYDPVLLKAVTPFVKEMQIKSDQRCVGDVPKWVVLVSSLGVALFFIILISLLLYHDKMKLPWWIMCICSSRAPWEESSSASSTSDTSAPEMLEKQSNLTRDIIAFAPPLKETTSSLS